MDGRGGVGVGGTWLVGGGGTWLMVGGYMAGGEGGGTWLMVGGYMAGGGGVRVHFLPSLPAPWV